MYHEIVGMDVLPNVYIDKIYISDRESIEIRLKMYDYAVNPSWRDLSFANNLEIKVMCYLTNDDQEIESLNFGNTLLHQHYSEARGVILSCNADFVGEVGVDNGFMYTCDVRFEIKNAFDETITFIEDLEKLNVYVTTFVEGFDFDQEEYQNIFGALFGEKIIQNFLLVSESGHFFFQETGEEYSGPVHMHPDSSIEDEDFIYMEGSNHSSGDHRYVYYYQEENFKIIDLREEER